jgi:hypothetical protein
MANRKGLEQTAASRAAFLSKFPDEQSKSEFFRDIGRKGNESRRAATLSPEDKNAIRQAFALLGNVVNRLDAGQAGPVE